MSLDMTMARREATFDSAPGRIEADAGPAAQFWTRDLLVTAATICGMLLSSALGVLLFLR
jgi:hypothetical protein